MINSLTLNKKQIKSKTLVTLIAVVSALVLPQVFHYAGMVSGMGTSIGSAFLPMHIPVILAGLMSGPLVGAIAGILSPLLSFAVSGMPGAVMLPFMILELGVYGLISGILANNKMPVFLKLIIAQISGRAVRAAAVLFSVYILGSETVAVGSIWNMIITAVPGILLQWALIPLLTYRLEGLKKHCE